MVALPWILSAIISGRESEDNDASFIGAPSARRAEEVSVGSTGVGAKRVRLAGGAGDASVWCGETVPGDGRNIGTSTSRWVAPCDIMVVGCRWWFQSVHRERRENDQLTCFDR